MSAHSSLILKADILINKDRRACITDFSLMTITGVRNRPFQEASQTSTFRSDDELMSFVGGGTTRWMSPEILVPDQFGIPASEGDRPTRQSDCYSLGMVIYEVSTRVGGLVFADSQLPLQVLCGHHPFYEIESSYLVTHVIIGGERPKKPEGAARLGFNNELWEIVERCWRANRDERPVVGEILSCLDGATAFWYMREL